jgi:hypothetical protein
MQRVAGAVENMADEQNTRGWARALYIQIPTKTFQKLLELKKADPHLHTFITEKLE